MNELSSLKLIDGKFIPDNAKEVLLSLINSKIEFHRKQVYGGDILNTERRIEELLSIKVLVNEAIDRSIKSNKKLIITGTINIKLED